MYHRVSGTKRIVTTALFASLIFLFTAYFLHIPVGSSGGYIHLGDSLIYIAASLMPFPDALFAAAIGAGLSDIITGSAAWAPATIVIKPLMALMFTASWTDIKKSRRNMASAVAAGLLGTALYFFYEWALYGLPAAVADMPMNLVQAGGSAAVYYAFAFICAKPVKDRMFRG